MNKITLKAGLFFILFAIVFTSCKDDEDKDIPVISLSGANPLTHDTINTPFNEPGVSTSEGTVITDMSAVYLNKTGEYTVYYSAIDDADNIGHATRKIIVRNPADQLVAQFMVEVINSTSGQVEDYYFDNLTADSYINGKVYFSHFDGACGASSPLYGKYDWNNQTIDIPEQTYNEQQVLNSSGSPFGVTFNGSDISFEMDVTSGGVTRHYVYRRYYEGGPTTNIMTIHTSPDAPAIDVFIDNVKKVTALPFVNNTGYHNVNSGNHTVKIYPTGTCTPVFTTLSFYDVDKYYSVFVVDYLATLDVIRFEDDLSNPTTNKARVRFVNAAAATPNLDLSFSGTTLIQNVGFKDINTIEVDPGTYGLTAYETGTTNVIATMQTISFSAGKVYTLYAAKDNSGNGDLRSITNK